MKELKDKIAKLKRAIDSPVTPDDLKEDMRKKLGEYEAELAEKEKTAPKKVAKKKVAKKKKR